jgi:hypothetical protein
MFAYQNPLDNIKKFFKSKSPLVYLIYINLGGYYFSTSY